MKTDSVYHLPNGDEVRVHPLQYSPIMPRDFVYVMAPYSHPEKTEREYRYHNATLCSALLMESTGCSVFSPISHSHSMAQMAEAIRPGSIPWEKWMGLDLKLMDSCNCGIVVLIPGWNESNGVATEIKKLAQDGKHIFGIDPTGEQPQYSVLRLGEVTGGTVPQTIAA